MKSKILILCASIAFGGLTSFAVNADPASNANQATPAATANSQGDAQILQTLIVLNTDEVNAGKLAEAQSTNPDVKKFAAHMQQDHSKGLKKTEDLAKKLNITPANSDFSNNLQTKDQDEATKLKSLSGTAFDQEYVNAMVQGHQDALNFLDNSLSQTTNAKLVKFLKATRETVAHHLEMAQELAKKING